MLSRTLFLFIITLCGYSVFAQPVFDRFEGIQVSENSKVFKYAWAGGLNNPQFSAADLNNDGTDDLLIFDRSGGKALTFLNEGIAGQISYNYTPRYEKGFPPEFAYWVLLDDLDCDGIADAFNSKPGQIDFYKGSYNQENELQFDSITYFQFNSNSGLINIFVTATDIPAIADINNDGDLDVLTFHILGTQMEYFENQSMELTGTCGDTMIFEQYSTCWGTALEHPLTSDFILDSCIFVRNPSDRSGYRHAGSTLLAFDQDGDNDKEVLIGDLSVETISFLRNDGDSLWAHIDSVDPVFPSYDISYQAPIFSASFYVDVNNDGLRDLIAAPNKQLNSVNVRNSWYYEQVGTEDSVIFEYRMDTFMVGEMIDLGEGASPVFFDHNSDGLLDIVSGNFGYYTNGVTYRSTLALFENVGTINSPEFVLVDRNYMNIGFPGLEGIHPTFGDLDDDGDLDMVIGEVQGFVHYYENIGGAGNTASFILSDPTMGDSSWIDPGGFSTPFLYDVNDNGVLDLVIGERSGNLNYYENKGTKEVYEFSSTPTNSFFGEIDVRSPGSFSGTSYSSPWIGALDSSGDIYVVSGSLEGKIKLYKMVIGNIYTGAFPEITHEYSNIDMGERTSLSIADITNNGRLDMVVGNYRGGFTLFSQGTEVSTGQTLRNDIQLTLFPNPANQSVSLQWSNLVNIVEVKILDLSGKDLIINRVIDERHTTTFDVSPLMPGIYFCEVSDEQGVQSVRKFVIQR